MPRAGRPVGLRGWDHQLPPAADLHSGDTVLPSLDETAQRELDGLTPTPGAVELFASVVLDADVVHFDDTTRHGFGSVPDHKVIDDELCGRGAAGKFKLWFAWHGCDPSPAHLDSWKRTKNDRERG